jgi:hypothetical protein
MNTYVILRRSAWHDAEGLQAAAERSKTAGEQMSADIRWIRSYVLAEASSRVGTVCIYEASGADAVRRHAEAAGLPADEIIEVADTVIIRPDPVVVENSFT